MARGARERSIAPVLLVVAFTAAGDEVPRAKPHPPRLGAISPGDSWVCTDGNCFRTVTDCRAAQAKVMEDVPGVSLGTCEKLDGPAACYTFRLVLRGFYVGNCFVSLRECLAAKTRYIGLMGPDIDDISDCMADSSAVAASAPPPARSVIPRGTGWMCSSHTQGPFFCARTLTECQNATDAANTENPGWSKCTAFPRPAACYTYRLADDNRLGSSCYPTIRWCQFAREHDPSIMAEEHGVKIDQVSGCALFK